MERKLVIINTKLELEKCFPVMKELRPHLSIEEFLSIYETAHKNDAYEIIAIEENGQTMALMGYRFLYDFVRGKHVYIDDLVTTKNARSRGFGAELLNYAEKMAEQTNCRSLRLCTGLDNEGGIKFYERNKWVQRAIAYVKKI